MKPAAEDQICFLQKVQRVLEEGVFTASYKYALLLSLADIAVERGNDVGDPLHVTIDQIAEKFVHYYWRQTRPYQSKAGASGRVLWQNTGRQAAIVTFVGRHQHSTVAQLQRDKAAWHELLRDTCRTIVDQPLWKLQVVGGKPLPFLYDHTGSTKGIELKGDAVFCLRRFHALVYDLVTAAWVRFVRQLPANQTLFGHTTDLAEFLFGTERVNLGVYRPILTAVQQGACFYCERRLGEASEVDHFVPWSRYPVDLAHNFVLAHGSCNNRKRDRLAAIPHLERWIRRNETHQREFEQRFEKAKLVYDLGASMRVTRWAYGQAATAGSLVWRRADDLEPLSPDWEAVFAAFTV